MVSQEVNDYLEEIERCNVVIDKYKPILSDNRGVIPFGTRDTLSTINETLKKLVDIDANFVDMRTGVSDNISAELYKLLEDSITEKRQRILNKLVDLDDYNGNLYYYITKGR